ncbi:MAG: GTPase HflX [Deltaproteobacteria bacterium]|nr:GTPase HflX [Deltaproteobacteria bacterium]
MDLHGNLSGLKPRQQKQLTQLYRRRCLPEQVISPELARNLTLLSADTGRQLGLLINRSGHIEMVIIGDSQSITIPSLHRFRLGHGRLRGVRCIHTSFGPEGLNREDITDLTQLRLDLMAVIRLDSVGLPENIEIAHLLPGGELNNYQVLPPTPLERLDLHCLELFHTLESSAAEQFSHKTGTDEKQRAIIISVGPNAARTLDQSVAEMTELALAANITVVDSFTQQRQLNPHTAVGSGKLKEIIIASMAEDVDLLLFDHDLSPTQVNNLSRQTELKVIDRTLLILDIFARRALSREGKLKVELAQLKYRLPRISEKTTALSRLTGGIGGRGPGETTLEIDRRRIRERISKLEKRLKKMAQSRAIARTKRKKNQLPLVSIVGYTNAGKSTLLNTLTQSQVFTENLPFATLDPTTRRLRLPREQEIIITDTVGFIKNLPKDLLDAFRTTLEELAEADLLLHVVDSSSSEFEEQIATVNQLLEELDLARIPTLIVANKIDLVPAEIVQGIKKRYQAIALSARQKESLGPLLEEIIQTLNRETPGRELSLQRPELNPPSPEPAQDKSGSPAEDRQKSFSPAQPH